MNKVQIVNINGKTRVKLNNVELQGVRNVEIEPIVGNTLGDCEQIVGTEVIIRLTVDELEVINESR